MINELQLSPSASKHKEEVKYLFFITLFILQRLIEGRYIRKKNYKQSQNKLLKRPPMYMKKQNGQKKHKIEGGGD
jgi:hypothetical protein